MFCPQGFSAPPQAQFSGFGCYFQSWSCRDGRGILDQVLAAAAWGNIEVLHLVVWGAGPRVWGNRLFPQPHTCISLTQGVDKRFGELGGVDKSFGEQMWNQGTSAAS